MTHRPKTAIHLLPILLVGFGLRVFQLGHDSLWNDEAGQAIAALQPTIRGMLVTERSHVFAMPLDYLVSRFVGQIGVSETILRFPSVIWGTLALALCFVWARMLAGRRVATLATVLLSLSTVGVHYSQEMRPYAALLCFSLLSNILLFRAIDRNGAKDWLGFIVAAGVGAYFHPFVLLSTVNGVVYLALRRVSRQPCPKALPPHTISHLALALVILPGVIYFGPQNPLDRRLLQWGDSIPHLVAQGLGLSAVPYAQATSAVGAWELAVAIFAVTGMVWVILHSRRYPRFAAALLGAAAQVTLILVADTFSQYWFLPRQLVHLAPVTLIAAALGMATVIDLLAGWRVSRGHQLASWGHNAVLAGLAALVCLAALPRLADYYRFPKSTGRQVTARILRTYRPGDLILVFPDYEEEIYRFYLLQTLNAGEVSRALRPTTWADLTQSVPGATSTAYLVTPALISRAQLANLTALGFRELCCPEPRWYGTQLLFVRPTATGALPPSDPRVVER